MSEGITQPAVPATTSSMQTALDFIAQLGQVVASTNGLQPILDWMVEKMSATLHADEGSWGIVGTGESNGWELGTRPVDFVPVHGDGQHPGNGFYKQALGGLEKINAERGIPSDQRTCNAAGTLAASAHQSHAYADGACLYFTFAGQPPRDERESYYRDAWDAGTRAVLAHGGALSHHHGIGLNRSRFMADAVGPGLAVLAAVKAALDPRGILNPGKLGLPSPFGPTPMGSSGPR